MDCNKPTYITQDNFSSCDSYRKDGKILSKQSYMYRNFLCDVFDTELTIPTTIPTVEDCHGDTTVAIAHNGEIVEEYKDVIVTWIYDCYNESWDKKLSYKDEVAGINDATVTSDCDDTTGKVTYTVDVEHPAPYVHPCENVTCDDGEFCDGDGNCVSEYIHPCELVDCAANETCDGKGNCVPNYAHPCDDITLGPCELCDGKGDVYSLPPIATDILCVDGDVEKAKVIWQLDCQGNVTYKNLLDLTPYTGDTSLLGECCCVGKCNPDCTCAATTPVGMTCNDGCGGACDGTMMEGCTPTCPNTDTYCPDDPIPDSGCPEVTCGQGTKDCTFSAQCSNTYCLGGDAGFKFAGEVLGTCMSDGQLYFIKPECTVDCCDNEDNLIPESEYVSNAEFVDSALCTECVCWASTDNQSILNGWNTQETFQYGPNRLVGKFIGQDPCSINTNGRPLFCTEGCDKCCPARVDDVPFSKATFIQKGNSAIDGPIANGVNFVIHMTSYYIVEDCNPIVSIDGVNITEGSDYILTIGQETESGGEGFATFSAISIDNSILAGGSTLTLDYSACSTCEGNAVITRDITESFVIF